jgi:hypothetical protein
MKRRMKKEIGEKERKRDHRDKDGIRDWRGLREK